jgi:outer membrane protein assembly factor BamB
MSSSRKATLTCTALLVLSLNLFAQDWPKFRRDNSNTGRSTETGISSANVASLKVKWTFSTGSLISAQPSVATVGGIRTVYVGSGNGKFWALNATTGAKRWSYTIDGCGSTKGTCRIGSSAAVVNGVVYFGAHNGYIYALNASTGALVWKKKLGDPAKGYAIWSSPLVVNGLVYVGVAGADDSPCVQGRVEAMSATTGTSAWTFDTIDPSSCPSGTCVGATVWSSPAYDPSTNILYITTGNPGSTCSPKTANAVRYPDSILALNANTGQLINYRKVNANDTSDHDFGSSPVLHSTSVRNDCTGSSSTKNWVTAYNKNHKVYTVSRSSAGLGSTIVTGSVDSWGVITPPLVPFTSTTSCSTTGQIHNQGDYYYVTTTTGKLYKFTLTPRPAVSLSWSRIPSGSQLYSSPTSITDLIFLGSFDHHLYAYNSSGTKRWSYLTGGGVASPPAISAGRVYIGSYDGKVYCFSINAQ